MRTVPTSELSPRELEALRVLLWEAFGDDPETGFTEDDWLHALGGLHVIVEAGEALLAHAAIVERTLEIDGRSIETGYVEGVAVDPTRQGTGLGTDVMTEVAKIITRQYSLGALGTESFHFYERLGWERWKGPSSVRSGTGTTPTPGEDGYIMILRTPSSPDFELNSPISCDWRPGDVW